MRRLIVGLLIVVVVFSGRALGAVTEIHLWHIFTGGHVTALENITARFHEANPDIRVVLTHQGGAWGDLNTKLVAATAAGTPPTLGLFKTTWVPAFYGALMPLDGVIPAEILNDIFPVFRADSTFEGRLLTVPFARSTNVLFYNTSLVPEPPATWEEMLTVAKEVRLDRDGDGVIDRFGKGIRPGAEQFTFLFLQAGGRWFNEEETEFLIDGPEGIQAMEYLRDLRDASLFQTGFFSGPFGEGAVAMYWGSTAGVPFVASAAEAHGTQWNIAKLPAGPLGISHSILMSASAGIFELGTTEEQRTAAVRFLLYLLSPEEHLYWVTGTGYLPYRQSLLELPEWQAFVKANPIWAGIAEQVPLSYGYPHHPEWSAILRVLGEATESVLLGVMTPEEAVRWAADEVEMGYLDKASPE
jgi:multiple sugar transport system substrate-binding protein